MSDYRTIFGTVSFDPREGNAAGKPIRNISIQQAGTKDQAIQWSATLWPDHAHVEVNKGDVVVVNGKANQTSGVDKEGNPRVYFNLSVSGIAVLGQLDTGSDSPAAAAVAVIHSGDDLF